MQRTAGAVTVSDAAGVLRGMLESLHETHLFLPDDQTATGEWPDWCRGANRSTDAHLVAFAEKHQAQLATLDESIPGAFVIPAL